MSEVEFARLFETHRRKLEVIARRYDRANWEDLLQDALVKAWRFRLRFEEGSHFDRWMARIIRNTFINGYRHDRALPFIESYSQEEPRFLDSFGACAPPECEGFSDEVLAALARLPDFQRRTILMADVERIPHEEVAEQLGISPITVKSRLVRTRNKLAVTLEGYGEAHGLRRMKRRPRAKRLDPNRKSVK